MQRVLAVCLDFGDTLADEASEVKDATQTTLRADLIPGAAELLHELKRRGYPLALVADGRAGTYFNVLSHYGLYHLFDVHTISEEVGVEKPDVRIFQDALDRLGLASEYYGRVVMVGNNLERDVKGANGVGMILTGMGRDGANGLKALRGAGGKTFSQDKDSCMVYEAPAAAMAQGAVEKQLPLDGLAAAALAIAGSFAKAA